MRKFALLVIASLLIFSGSAFASPFLVCDPATAVDTYEVYQDGVLLAADIVPEADGSIKYDLSGVTPGQYDWTARACNIWGCSTFSNPTQSPAAALPPSLRLEK